MYSLCSIYEGFFLVILGTNRILPRPRICSQSECEATEIGYKNWNFGSLHVIFKGSFNLVKSPLSHFRHKRSLIFLSSKCKKVIFFIVLWSFNETIDTLYKSRNFKELRCPEIWLKNISKSTFFKDFKDIKRVWNGSKPSEKCL